MEAKARNKYSLQFLNEFRKAALFARHGVPVESAGLYSLIEGLLDERHLLLSGFLVTRNHEFLERFHGPRSGVFPRAVEEASAERLAVGLLG